MTMKPSEYPSYRIPPHSYAMIQVAASCEGMEVGAWLDLVTSVAARTSIRARIRQIDAEVAEDRAAERARLDREFA